MGRRLNRSSVHSGAKAPSTVPSPGSTSRVGKQPAAIGSGLGGAQARITPIPPGGGNTRDYGKPQAAAPQPSPFGPSAGNSNIGGF
jgi:hypothetical protein